MCNINAKRFSMLVRVHPTESITTTNNKIMRSLLLLLFSLLVSAMEYASAGIANDLDADYGRLPSLSSSTVPLPRTDDSTVTEEETVIAICGGGLAGLAAAIGLERHGIKCRVYERAPHLRSISQGMLSLWPNGLAALEHIHPDLPPSVARVACPLEQLIFIPTDPSLERRIRPGLDRASIEKYGTVPLLIQWHQLQQCLAELLPDNIVVTGRSLLSFEERRDHVLLHFEDGTRVTCQAMLACDGSFSRARQQILPGDKPIYFGQLNWNAIIPTSDALAIVNNTVTLIQHNGHSEEPRKWSAYLNDCGCGQTFWQLRLVDPEKAMAISGSSGRGGLGLKGIKEALCKLVAPSKELLAAIEQTPEEQIFERCIIGRNPAETWISAGGRVALVGDAAHAMHPLIGQGGNMAFESASAVIDALKECNSDFVAGLKRFEATRKRRADLVQRYANLMGAAQSSGEFYLSPDSRTTIDDWIKGSKAAKELDLPPEEENLMREFDPCSESNVTQIDL